MSEQPLTAALPRTRMSEWMYDARTDRWVPFDSRDVLPPELPILELLYTTSPTRTGYAALDGSTVPNGPFYVVLAAASEPVLSSDLGDGFAIDHVDFTVPGTPTLLSEYSAPFDAAGADPATNVPHPITLTAGTAGHVIIAAVYLTDGTVVPVRATFTIASTATPDLDLLFSDTPDWAATYPAAGATVGAQVYPVLTSDLPLDLVEVFIDGTKTQHLTAPPYALAGTTGGTPDPLQLADGDHTLRVRATTAAGVFEEIAGFHVAIAGPTAPPTPTSMTVIAGDRTVRAFWPAVAHATHYVFKLDDDVVSPVEFTGRELVVQSLVNGRMYVPSLAAVNEHGMSGFLTGQPVTPRAVDATRPRRWNPDGQNNNTGPQVALADLESRPGGKFTRNGELVEGYRFTSMPEVGAYDVHFKNCWHVDASLKNPGIKIGNGYGGTLIEYCRFGAGKTGLQGNGSSNDSGFAEHGGNMTVRYSDMGNMGDAGKIQNRCLWEWNYCRADRNPDNWATHVDGLQSSGRSHTTLRFNFVDMPNGGRTNAAVFFEAYTGSSDGHRYDCRVHNNWIKGTKYGLQAGNGKDKAGNPTPPGGWLHDYGAWDNIFIRLPVEERFDRGPANDAARAFLEAVPPGTVPIGWFEDDASKSPVPFGNVYNGA